MAASKVYYANMRTSFYENLPQKLERLIKTAGIGGIDFEKKYAAIKIHFGEPGNLAYLRPNYASVVVRVIKELGGKAFLTDCNTLYVGGRKNALDHMDAAYENGLDSSAAGSTASTGQTPIHRPQPTHLSWLISAFLFTTTAASCAHILEHIF